MNNDGEQINRPGNGHLFWGIVFAAMGGLSLYRKMVVISGIPVWALSFFMLAAANLLKAPSVESLLRIDRERPGAVRKVASALNILGIAILVITFIYEFYKA